MTLKRWVMSNAGRSFGHGVVYNEDEVECARPPYYAVFLGLDDIVMSTLSSPPNDVNFKGRLYCYPLQAASFGGYDGTVSLLLERGVDVNTGDGYYRIALIAAATQAISPQYRYCSMLEPIQTPLVVLVVMRFRKQLSPDTRT